MSSARAGGMVLDARDGEVIEVPHLEVPHDTDPYTRACLIDEQLALEQRPLEQRPLEQRPPFANVHDDMEDIAFELGLRFSPDPFPFVSLGGGGCIPGAPAGDDLRMLRHPDDVVIAVKDLTLIIDYP
eukprot:CAMPEP_0118875890 /NCGR_PEP_ID=MMETSP1163-20130328/16797_1 /TAXON_ID=124430 /ORGANISM="Phaeomonas parva, Strain CCMP2877" /LENGTH=127 /DNA_ID=CAMNT_0006811443 /DNA_START=256 /DNA_END=637 /DNA_ORIENTATION=-